MFVDRKKLRNLSSGTIKHTSLARRIAVLAAIVSTVALGAPSVGSAATFTVNSTDDVDDGACGVHCSLREAINASNLIAGTDMIRFDIPLPPFTIKPTLPLPTVTDPALIDGTTQPGFSGTPIVELDGSAAGVGDGLRITAGNSTVRGLVINRFSSQVSGFAGITLELGGGNLIAGNYIGTNPAGTAASPNNHGVQILNSSGNTIGGTAPGTRNVISGNSAQGVLLTDAADGNLIEGNFIGTDAGGAVDLGNGASGVFVGSEGASDNTIGGTSAAARNVISGNGNHGVILIGPSTTDNSVQGNFVGTDAAGTAGLGNAVDGVRVRDGSNNNTIGGTASGAGNVISDAVEFGVLLSDGASDNVVQGNFVGTDATGTAALGNGADFVGNGAGVRLDDATTNNTIGGTAPGAGNVISANLIGVHLITGVTGNLVQGNLIGTDASGTAPLGNIMEGVRISFGPSANTIGGTTPGAGNTIAFNGLDGVRVVQGVANALLSNSIFSNGSAGFRGLGIDLIRSDDVVESGGFSPNDESDLDTGGNNVQNFPVLASVLSDGESTVVQGTLNSQPATAYRLEFFSNETCFPEGKILLGSTNVATDADGNASFTETFATAVPASQVVTSTATDPAGNTSEFSRCQVVDPAADLALTKSASPASVRVGEPLTYTLDVTNKSPSSASGVTLTDLLPKSVRLRSARSDHGRCARRSPRRVDCNLAEFSGGETATVTIVVRPTRRGTIVNTAIVRASQPIDLKPANNTAIATSEVSP